MINLYHGSNVSIDNIDLSKSKKGKDFGKGFYLNPDFGQALEMAEYKSGISEWGVPTVTAFDFDMEKAIEDGLKIKVFEEYCEEWANFVVENRKNNSNSPIHPYDIVIGPIADDKVGFQIRLYADGDISVKKLISRIRYKKEIAMQYFFANEKSLTYLFKKA